MSAATAPESPSDAASEAPTEAASSGVKNCGKCQKLLPVSVFGYKPDGALFKQCEPCRENVNAAKKRYKDGDKFKATLTAYYATGAPQASSKRYKETDEYEAWKKRYKDSNKNKERMRRMLDRQKDRRAANPEWKLMVNTITSAHMVLTGAIKNSPNFLTRTGWESDAFRIHVLASVPPGSGFTIANYGKTGVWEIDHRIPQQAYNFADPNDILRCWNPRNVRGISRVENKSKGMKLLDDQMAYVCADCFPASWNGEVPTEEERQAFYQRVKDRQEMHDEGDSD
jgi:hypothetical protein